MVAISALVLAGCTHEVDERVMPDMPCDTAVVTWSITIEPLLQTHCALPACHVSGGNGTGDFTTYAGVLSQVSSGKLLKAVQRLPGAIPMPPDGSTIPACDIARLRIWVGMGAPEN